MVTLGSDDSCTGCWVVLLLSLSSVAYLHAHFRAQPEESCDQVVGLQDALLVHLEVRGGGERGERREIKQEERVIIIFELWTN